MTNLVNQILNTKTRIVKLAHGEKDNISYTRRCFKDITAIKNFRYKGKNHQDYNYFSSRPKGYKKGIYIFEDILHKQIIIYDILTKENTVVKDGQEQYYELKQTLANARIVSYYYENSFDKFSKIILMLVFVLFASALLLFFLKKITFSELSPFLFFVPTYCSIESYRVIYTERIESKSIFKPIILSVQLIILIVLILTLLISLFYAINFDEIAIFYTILGVVVTIGSIPLYFYKKRDD